MADTPEQAPSGNGGGQAQDTATTTLVWAKAWDVISPPPRNTTKGSLVPNILTRKHRRVSVEVHRIPVVNPSSKKNRSISQPEAQEGLDYYEECIVRILVPDKKHKELRKKLHLKDEDMDDDDASVGGMSFAYAYAEIEDTPDYAGWKAKYRLPLETITIKEVHKKTVDIIIHYRDVKHDRDLVFELEQDATDFVDLIEIQKNAGERRAAAKLKAALGVAESVKVDNKAEMTLLIEVVSGWDLPAGDLSTSDPFVVCFINGREVHRTKYIPKTLDPIWTVKEDSLFLLTLTAEELFTGEGLVCVVFDFDKFGSNEKLGITTVPSKVLYECSGERLEYELVPPNEQTETSGALAIRCRRATEYDKKFMAELNAEGRKHKMHIGVDKIAAKAQELKGGKGALMSALTIVKKTERHGEDKGLVKYKIRPGPDPKRVEETTWMTKEKIEEEVAAESHHWLDTGSGSLARVFVEILGCDGLPNLDTGGFTGNKTDTFVCLVFEDTVVWTDPIDDCLSPRWLPWSKRAFIFHMMHSSSSLFLGVFDFDPGPGDHDLIGRVTVDLSNLQKDTKYDLAYDIYPTAKMTDRKKMGTIKIRLRMEVDDERKMLISTLEPPPTVYVNVKTRKEWRLVRYTCQGKYDMDAYSMKVINSYVEELLAYKVLMYHAQDAVIALLLWRGHFNVTIAGRRFLLPLHSLTAFLQLIILVERPRLIPSFCFMCIAWLLIATMGWRRRIPNPWQKCKSFDELAQILVSGDSLASPATIEAFEHAEEAAKFQEEIEKRVIEAEEQARIAYEEKAKEQEEEMKELEDIGGDTDISTKAKGGFVPSIDVFKPFLYPIQQYLGIVVGCVRVTRNIVIWEEPYIAFWLCAGCFVLALAAFFVPWFFLLRWTSRLVVWTLFGPWMKLVDIFWYSKLEMMTEEQLEKQKLEAALARRLKLKEAVTKARIKREDAEKLKAMKKIMFGKFVTQVPIMKQDRHRDVPLAQSSATPFVPKKHSLAALAMKEAGYRRTRLPGQHLVGDMIPRIEAKAFTDAPVGQPTKNPSLLDKKSPGADPSKDSDATAYVKLGAVMGAAGVVTYFLVPILSTIPEKMFG